MCQKFYLIDNAKFRRELVCLPVSMIDYDAECYYQEFNGGLMTPAGFKKYILAEYGGDLEAYVFFYRLLPLDSVEIKDRVPAVAEVVEEAVPVVPAVPVASWEKINEFYGGFEVWKRGDDYKFVNNVEGSAIGVYRYAPPQEVYENEICYLGYGQEFEYSGEVSDLIVWDGVSGTEPRDLNFVA
ncbi:hypothetical protein EQP59_09620 [Ornithobacterium rhinotracheale]|uniref:Uncharacterized protein n=1 Tax=Ornithobacterium rhinotracheale TaxID=28251 RepID=A0A410JU67_ORNRH|nr:hypothetical protein [Ornithobacterium rhinotracheale]QAR31486.1 hypothetical protein EQP59_09105 [Ornithobacterium rhinotracheale]QAR31578.1 hypothetical protein EQP59_09620 [Ornithobacterium rhinotracheale]